MIPSSLTDLAGEPVGGPPTARDLEPSTTFDFDHPAVDAWVRATVGDATDDAERARRLFAAVRDGIRYDATSYRLYRETFVASAVLAAGESWCVPKAILLAAAARAVGIPARLGFADVRNHLSTEKLREQMGTDVFAWHGYAVLHLDGGWRKASPAFNRELCERFGVPALDFDGTTDALLHAYDGAGRRHMEYLADHGTWTDVPIGRILERFAELYGPSMVDAA